MNVISRSTVPAEWEREKNRGEFEEPAAEQREELENSSYKLLISENMWEKLPVVV